VSQKNRIWYARTYRHLQVNRVGGIVFMLCIAAPCFLLLCFNLERITKFMSDVAGMLIKSALPGKFVFTTTSEYPPFGKIFTLSYYSAPPGIQEVTLNLLIVLAIIIIMLLSSFRGRPLMIYLLFSFMVHIISCVFYAFAEDTVIYTGEEFSGLLIKQQIGIWLLFIVLVGLVVGFFYGRAFGTKLLAFFGIMAYSACVGFLRYTVFNFILVKVSSLYMADMFFVAGPMYDFLYMVAIYALFQRRMQKIYDSGKRRNEWKWL